MERLFRSFPLSLPFRSFLAGAFPPAPALPVLLPLLPALRHFLGESMRPGDQVMLVSYDRSLKVRQPFTTSSNLIFARLEEIYDDTGFAAVRQREQFDALKYIDDSRQEVSALSVAMNYADSQMVEVEETAEALQELIESMGGLPGRKALVYLSSGVPMLAGEEMFHAVGSKFQDSRAFSEIGRHDTSRYFERVARKADTHRVVFYTLDAGGQRGFQFGAAEYGDFVSPELRRTLDSTVVENLQSPLRLLAQETGGRAILNRNEAIPGLAEVTQDLRTFYSLGISTANAHEGRYHDLVEAVNEIDTFYSIGFPQPDDWLPGSEHDIKIDVKGRGYLVRHQESVRVPKIGEPEARAMIAALMYQTVDNPLGIRAHPGSEVPRDDGTAALPVLVEMPVKNLAMVPHEDTHAVSLTLFVATKDAEGNPGAVQRIPFHLDIPNDKVEEAKVQSAHYSLPVVLRKGDRQVAVGVRDDLSGAFSVVRIDVGQFTQSL